MQNAVRNLRGNRFKAFVHSTGLMEETVRGQGFELAFRRGTWIWRSDIYLRRV